VSGKKVKKSSTVPIGEKKFEIFIKNFYIIGEGDKMKKLNFAILIFCFWLIPAFAQTIHSVKIGYEVPSEGPFPTALVFHGDTVIIVWQSTSISGNVRIELRRQTHSLAAVIVPAYPFDDIPKAYQIPSSISPGKYYIKVRQGNVSGNSGIFRIMPPRGIKWVNVFLEGKPYPKAGFKPGQTLAASWDTSHLLGTVSVILKKNFTKSFQMRFKPIFISQNRPYNDIPATFKIPMKIVAGNYTVEVKQGKVTQRSESFKILKNVLMPINKKRLKLR
jgi:hypothetical protein